MTISKKEYKELKKELSLIRKEKYDFISKNGINGFKYYTVFKDHSLQTEDFKKNINNYHNKINYITYKIEKYEITKKLHRSRLVIGDKDYTFYLSKKEDQIFQCHHRYDYIFSEIKSNKIKIEVNNINGREFYFYIEKTKNKLSEKIINKEEEVYKFININELFYNDLIYIRDNNIKIEFNEDDAFFNIRDGYFKFIFNEEYYKLLEY